MSATLIRGRQVLDASIQRVDLDTVTSGQAVATKIVQGAGITLSSTGVDSGTGDVTVSATADPGTWTTPSFATGWSDGGSCAYRIQVIGSVSTVFCRGIALQAAAAAAAAFTLPSGARPSMLRVCNLGGFQNDDDATQVLVLYAAQIATTGIVSIYPVIKYSAVWPINAWAQNVYLDSLIFSL